MNYRNIDTAGQKTAIITSKIIKANLPTLASEIMQNDKTIEQVGLLRKNNFYMMGGELSINGLLAAAFVIGKKGLVNKLSFNSQGSQYELELPGNLIKNITKNIVSLDGITYEVTQGIPKSYSVRLNTITKLKSLSDNSPASGIIYYVENCIKPLIYVKATNTYVWENACGSGSLAFSLITGIKKVIQPSGECISYQINNKNITVTATVKEI